MKRNAMTSALFALLLSGAALAQSSSSGSAMLVLDASGSMWGQIDGRTKIELAREAVDGLLADWPSDVSLGLMAYGHRRKGDCADIEVIRPSEGFDGARLRSDVAALSPKGMTPISAAVREAAEQLRFVEQAATVILVSDGEETCNADPCALGRELEALGVAFTAHVVGFDVEHGSMAQQQLQCLAEQTGGRYFHAADGQALIDALQSVSAPQQVVEKQPSPDPRVLAREGEAWMRGVYLEGVADVPLDPTAPPGRGAVDFTVDQTASDCQALCDADETCHGWHYEPTGSYFVSYPRCFTHGGGFAVRVRPEGEDWFAGIKPGKKLILIESEGEE